MPAPKGNNFSPNGRPKTPIDWTLFEQLCAVQCTQSEIASMLKIHIDTLRDRAEKNYDEDYSNIYKKYSENGKCSLRRSQFVMSKTNCSMAIWLGKQWLGQKDREEEKAPPNDSKLTDLLNLLNQITQLKEEIHRLKSETNTELLGSLQAI